MKYDATLKQLFEHSARGLLHILTGSTVAEWINVELARVNVPRMDLLGRLSHGGLCNIEFQTTNDPFLAERLGVYYLEALMKHGKDVDQVVLYLGREPMRTRHAVETSRMHFRFRLLDIGELDGDELAASGDLGDAMLAVLARVRSRRENIRHLFDRIATLKEKERELAIEQLLILTGLRGIELEIVDEARAYMPFVIDLMENRVFRQRYERGLAEGEAKGVAQGEARLLRRLLRKRFGSLPLWAQNRIKSASPKQLESWSLAMLDAATLEDVLGKPADQ